MARCARSLRRRFQSLLATVLSAFLVGRLRSRVRTLREVRADPDCTFYLEFGCTEAITCRAPELADNPLPEPIAVNIGTHHRPSPGIGVIRGVVLSGLHRGRFRPVGRMRDGRFLDETSHATRFVDHELKWPFHPRDLLSAWRNTRIDSSAMPQRFNLACTCAFPFHIGNYYHWMVQTLPRLWGLERYISHTGRRPTILLSPDPPGWIRESLSAVGYGNNDLDFFGEEGAFVDELLVLPFMERDRFLSLNAYQWLTKRLRNWHARQALPASTPPPLIYITRRKQQRRLIVNEDDLMTALERAGFTCIDAEDYSLAEKFALFSECRILISAHGAGLVNMMFTSGAGIMELFPARVVTSNYFVLANCLGHTYSYMLCRADSEGNMSVDVDAVLSRIEGLMAITDTTP